MKQRPSKILSAATVAFLVISNCSAGVYSTGIYPGGVTYFSPVAIGLPPFRVGWQEYTYSTDSAGSIITRPNWRTPQPDDIFHDYTEIYVGPLKFQAPVRPTVVLVVGGVVFATVLTLVDFALRIFKRKRYETRVA